MKKITVKIERSTKKAHLVIDENNRKGWVQNRSINENNEVNIKTFEKAVVYFEGQAKSKAATSDFNNSYKDLGEVARETEKAVAVEASWECVNSNQSGTRTVWFPKSQVKDGQVKGWLVKAKIRELKDVITSANTTFEISLCGVSMYV